MLTRHPAVEHCAVTATTDGTKLTARYVARGDHTPVELRNYLVDLLPQAMVPSHWTQLEQLPLNTNGKVDRRALSAHTAAFGGKQGLLEELRARRSRADEVPSDATFAESLARHLEVVTSQPDWSGLVLWQALGDDPGERDTAAEAQRTGLREAVERVRRRQHDGEIAGDLDPEFVLLLSYMLAFAPLALPRHVAGILGVDPLSPEYRDRCVDQLTRLLAPDR